MRGAWRGLGVDYISLVLSRCNSFISYSRLCECFKGVNSLVVIFIDRQSLISYLATSDIRLTEGFLQRMQYYV